MLRFDLELFSSGLRHRLLFSKNDLLGEELERLFLLIHHLPAAETFSVSSSKMGMTVLRFTHGSGRVLSWKSVKHTQLLPAGLNSCPSVSGEWCQDGDAAKNAGGKEEEDEEEELRPTKQHSLSPSRNMAGGLDDENARSREILAQKRALVHQAEIRWLLDVFDGEPLG